MKKIITFICIVVLSFAICYMAYEKYDINGIFYGCLFISIFVFPFLLYEDRRREENNPLSVKRVINSLRYIVSEGYGTKSSFIAKNSEEMYNYFLERGAIHELRTFTYVECKKQKVWEITVKGRNWAKNNEIK